MFIDASAIVAILTRESDWQDLLKRITIPTHVSPVSRFEAIVSLARIVAGPTGRRPTAETIEQARQLVDAFLREIDALAVDVSDDIGSRAVDAAMRYGKVVGHPAALNFGDCFAYACAKALNVPLLYKGDDFARTDLA